jgi:hypothetical protein
MGTHIAVKGDYRKLGRLSINWPIGIERRANIIDA